MGRRVHGIVLLSVFTPIDLRYQVVVLGLPPARTHLVGASDRAARGNDLDVRIEQRVGRVVVFIEEGLDKALRDLRRRPRHDPLGYLP